MSWYLFKQSPAVQQRGKKVEGFNFVPKPKVNLSWGMNEVLDSRPPSNYSSLNHHNSMGDTVPATFMPQAQNQPTGNNTKVLTETSDDEQQELIKLIKAHKEKKIEQEVMEHFNNRKRSLSNKNSEASKVQKSGSRASRVEMDKRIRFLENSLLPSSRRSNVAAVFDYDLNRQVPLEESRASGISVLHNKKNETTMAMGDGYNHFSPPPQPKKDLLDKLRQNYEYEDNYSRRMDKSHFHLG